MVSKHYEEEMIDIEKDKLDIYNRDVISAMQDRANNERYRNNMEITYNNMLTIARLQTYLMVLQSVIFACILFSI